MSSDESEQDAGLTYPVDAVRAAYENGKRDGSHMNYERGHSDGVRAERERVVGIVKPMLEAYGMGGLVKAINDPEHPPRARSESGQSGGGPVDCVECGRTGAKSFCDGCRLLRKDGEAKTLRLVREAWEEYENNNGQNYLDRPCRTLELHRALERILNPRPEPEPDNAEHAQTTPIRSVLTGDDLKAINEYVREHYSLTGEPTEPEGTNDG